MVLRPVVATAPSSLYRNITALHVSLYVAAKKGMLHHQPMLVFVGRFKLQIAKFKASARAYLVDQAHRFVGLKMDTLEDLRFAHAIGKQPVQKHINDARVVGDVVVRPHPLQHHGHLVEIVVQIVQLIIRELRRRDSGQNFAYVRHVVVI